MALWCAVIFAGSARPGGGERDLLWTLVAKSAHLAEYFILARLLKRAGVSPLPAMAFCVLYAASDEWHQSFVPGRHPSAWDVLIDGAGALTGTMLRAIL